MPIQIWIAIATTLIACIFVANGLRHIKAGPGHRANAGRLHIVSAVVVVPVIWVIALMQAG